MSSSWLAVPGNPTCLGERPEIMSPHLRLIKALSTSSTGSQPEGANTSQGMPATRLRRFLTCMQRLVLKNLGLVQRFTCTWQEAGDMTQLGKFSGSLMPAHQRGVQLWVQSRRHLHNLSWGPRFHKEGAGVDITHLALILLEAVRLVGVGHKAQFKLERCTGAGLGTVYQVEQATLEQLQQGSHAGTYCRLTRPEGVGLMCMLHSVPNQRKPTLSARSELIILTPPLRSNQQNRSDCLCHSTSLPALSNLQHCPRENCAAAGCIAAWLPKH